MKKSAVFAVLTLAATLGQAQTPEALKSATLDASWRSAAQAVPPPASVAPVQQAQTALYELGGFTFENDARSAMQAAEANLRAAGLRPLRASLTRRNGGGYEHGFRVEYFETNDPARPPRAIASADSGDFVFETDAANALRNHEADLRARGYAVISGQALRRAQWPNRYHYRLRYAVNGAAERGLYTSGAYGNYVEAERSLNAKAAEISRGGHHVWDRRLYHDARTRWYFYQLRYRR